MTRFFDASPSSRLSWLGTLTLIAGGLVALVTPGLFAAQQNTPAVLAFRHVTVIDVTDGRRLPDQTVIIAGNRVQDVGPAATVEIPTTARLVDARGKYMIPGLWDMHIHFSPTATQHYPRLIANGITGIRGMAQRWPGGADSFRIWQRKIMDGTLVGPRNIGPSADLGIARNIKTEEQARRIIDSLKAAGDAFVKFHGDNLLRPDTSPERRRVIFALLRESRRVGLPFVGHTARAVTNVEFADSGIRSIEHFHMHFQCWTVTPPAKFGPLPDSVDLAEKCPPVAQAYIRNGTWLTPTLAGYRVARGADESNWNDVRRFWRTMRRLGVRKILAGTDLWPGLSGRRELMLLVDVGFTPLEALQAGTLNPARFLEATDSLGTVAPGKLADLVLLDADPLVNIANILKLWGVVANGRYFDRPTLESMDPRGFRNATRLLKEASDQEQDAP